jgi:hypothetical protein
VAIDDLLVMTRFAVVPSGFSGAHEDPGEFIRFLPEWSRSQTVRDSGFSENRTFSFWREGPRLSHGRALAGITPISNHENDG